MYNVHNKHTMYILYMYHKSLVHNHEPPDKVLANNYIHVYVHACIYMYMNMVVYRHIM